MEQEIIHDIFFSYRHGNSSGDARALHERLKNLYEISFDVENIYSGELPDILYKRIDECTDFIIFVAKDTFDRTLNSLDDKDDWVRIELAYALKCNKNVIPIKVRIDDFPRNLPPDIAQICHKSGPKYDDYYFDAFVEKLRNYFLKSKAKPTYDFEEYIPVEKRKVKNAAEYRETILQSFSPIDLLRMFFKSFRRVKQ